MEEGSIEKIITMFSLYFKKACRSSSINAIFDAAFLDSLFGSWFESKPWNLQGSIIFTHT